MQLVLGPLAGIAVGYAGARILDAAGERGLMDMRFEGAAILAFALLSAAAATWLGGNGFIAAFVCGLVFGNMVRLRCAFLLEFIEAEGQILVLATFFIFGAVIVPENLGAFGWAAAIYAIASLVVIRPIAVSLSPVGTKESRDTRLFFGWFGSRGLASLLFVLFVLEELPVPHGDTVLAVTVLTVAFSIVLHGITANPGARWYGARHNQDGD